ncbi:hypothetical protein NQS96_07820 [Pseudoalteromonas shioyasakiensis]|uniref:hypothetical protein n=1 Tax=Pseudoalteromonas shioyasakiensis TaxID=1190813 RepID=UPI002118CB96|nr:hypothetical protein [Pseudoalteromonas shioyasakiensis]MCQ8881702.1 hypothetical protein [Pseudoalteromonas shioyasakiensis]
MENQCNCFDDNFERIKNHLIETGAIPEGAIDIEFEWQGRAFILSAGDFSPVNPKINFQYRAPKKGGGHARNLRKSDVSIFATHCCYCGRKYNKKKDD